ncbi:ATP-dependent helicase [Acidithiobacillus ferridurans]|uniref:DNA 3'-5' helicase n=1 Tax=Acidithiobacillus ferridurans TaxID=1232575 RepID=A0A8X8KD01_ACIFI|nr:UvrD-helicase domain-containing protein [Acidithiobacillus ferridurans]MBU2714602.1 UvrD-helicase domain-containing protein [Acidithiobacillus ferridurans]MBU2723879.1 UvrD-helicase domain-containing protein [Acidithiobacillus ferridurans]MBU2726325.1 UvrD-helicase domain-containing protein [Acidithiobacillus ferridurans]
MTTTTIAAPAEADLLIGLNAAQEEAVVLPLDAHAVILAGAGTGKTRVLTHRIAWAIEQGMDPASIVAVTFTNKAASEMRERLRALVGDAVAQNLRLGTFHSLGLKVLRRYGHILGFRNPERLSPMDQDESVALLRRVMKAYDAGIDLKIEKPRDHYGLIGHWKDKGLEPQQVRPQKEASRELTRHLYAAYEKEKFASQTVDFADLILLSNRLFRTREDIAKTFQKKLRMILVDEFQDTNPIQLEFIHHLSNTGKSVSTFVVGDDDQSIYGWRGADADIFQTFMNHHQPCELVRLEENYRCTSVVLDAANAVIQHNETRIGKNLWTQRQDVGPFGLSVYADGDREADAVAEQIGTALQQGASPKEIAILYRVNAMSRPLEKALIVRSIPYKVFGGLNFYQRREVKDAMAYLRLTADPRDDAAFMRAIAVPRRGIGAKTIEGWQTAARARGASVFDVVQGETKPAVAAFLHLLNDLRVAYRDAGLVGLAKACVFTTKLDEFYIETAKERGEECVENLRELISTAGVFHHRLRTGGIAQESIAHHPGDPLSEFITEAVMDSDAAVHLSKKAETVSLMTVHKAKGLEFPHVFVVGLEEGEFPKISPFRESNIEEERRLFYVAMTRSKYQLQMSYALSRWKFGREDTEMAGIDDAHSGEGGVSSRFLSEIPSHLFGDGIMVGDKKSLPSPVAINGRLRGSDAGDWW